MYVSSYLSRGNGARPPCNALQTLHPDTLCPQDGRLGIFRILSVYRGAANLITRPTWERIQKIKKRKKERAVNFAYSIGARVWANQWTPLLLMFHFHDDYTLHLESLLLYGGHFRVSGPGDLRLATQTPHLSASQIHSMHAKPWKLDCQDPSRLLPFWEKVTLSTVLNVAFITLCDCQYIELF